MQFGDDEEAPEIGKNSSFDAYGWPSSARKENAESTKPQARLKKMAPQFSIFPTGLGSDESDHGSGCDGLADHSSFGAMNDHGSIFSGVKHYKCNT